MLAAGALIHTEKALKGKAPRRQTRHRERGRHRRRTGDDPHGNAPLVTLVDQLLTRVRDGGHPRVGDQHRVLPREQAGADHLAALPLIVFEIAHQRLRDAEVVEQL